MTTTQPDTDPDLSPLELAREHFLGILAIGRAQAEDPTRARAMGLGQAGRNSAELAAYMAVVSIAEDLHRIVEDRAARAARVAAETAGAADVLMARARGNTIGEITECALAQARDLYGADAVLRVEHMDEVITRSIIDEDEKRFQALVYVRRNTVRSTHAEAHTAR